MTLQESGEMYLETILILSKRHNIVRAVDIADYMGFSKPAISRALNKLREANLIITNSEGYIAFTENGRTLAEKVYKKHVVLTDFIMKLGVDEKTASDDACKIEHVISDKTFEAIMLYARNHS